MRPIPEWHVAFGDWGANIWWHRLCRKGFRHVLAFGYDARAKVWVVVETAFDGLTVSTIAPEALDALISELWRLDAKILRCRVEGNGPKRLRLFASCVTVILALLGLPVSAVSPYGLYRTLLARGAQPAFLRASCHASSDTSVHATR
jgi:hypothetical protein